MMKVLHIIDSGGLYGAEVMLLNLMEEQVKLGVDPILASIGELNSPEKPIEEKALKKGLAVRKFRMRPGPNLLGALRILRYAWEQDVDLLHSHGYKGNILFGFIPKCFRKLPLVSTVHGWTSTVGFTKMKVYEWFDFISLCFIDVIVLVHRAMKEHPKLAGREKLNIRVVNNGIVINEQTNAVRKINLDSEIISLCKSGFTIGAVGRLSPEKGFDNLLEAIKIIRNKRDDVRLIVIGEGRQRTELERKVVKLDLSDHVFLAGFKENARDYIPYFDLFVLSSLSEGLPMIVLEVMDARVPIVSTKVGGVPEVLGFGEYGLLVGHATGIELSDGIMQIITDPEKGKNMAEGAKLNLEKHYSSAIMAKQYVDIYCSVC